MFYEQPSMKMIIDGFFQNKNHTYKEFEALFGFDKIKTGLPYEMLQACTVVYVENCVKEFPYELLIDNEVKILFNAKDSASAFIRIFLNDGVEWELRYFYRTDNFPSIEIIRTDKEGWIPFRVRDLVQGCGVPLSDILNITGVLIPFLTQLLYKAYGEYHEYD